MERLIIRCTLFLGCCILAAGSLPRFIDSLGPVGFTLLASLMFPIMALAAFIMLLFLVGDLMK